MELGEKLRQARLEAGLSQRALCGEKISRNMLSQIENGGARPSMGTLQYLAARLGRPVSWFLEEEAVCSANQTVMEQARQRFDSGDHSGAAAALEDYREPDPVFDREKQLLEILICLFLAEGAVETGRLPYARELLEKAGALGASAAYYTEELERRRLLLLGRAGQTDAVSRLPSLDEELLLRAKAALSAGETERAWKLLCALENGTDPGAALMKGRCRMKEKDYQQAAAYFQQAEARFPEEAVQALEVCFRELGDYRKAYFYACKQRRGAEG